MVSILSTLVCLGQLWRTGRGTEGGDGEAPHPLVQGNLRAQAARVDWGADGKRIDPDIWVQLSPGLSSRAESGHKEPGAGR